MRVHPGSGVPLVVDPVARVAVVLAAEEVVEAHLVERRRRRVRREMAADAVTSLVGSRDHDRRIPADDPADAPLHLLVAGEPRFLIRRDRVDVRRRHQRRHRDLEATGTLEELADDKAGPDRALRGDQRVEELEPLAGLCRVRVGKLMEEGVERHSRRGYTPERSKPPDFPSRGLCTNLWYCRGKCSRIGEPCLLVNPLSVDHRRVSRIRHTTLQRGDSGTTGMIRVPR